MFQKGRNETFSFLIVLQKNICSRGYALSYGITAHFFRVRAAFGILLYCPSQNSFLTGPPDCMLFLTLRCATCTVLLRITGVNCKKKSREVK